MNNDLKIIKDPRVESVFNHYPNRARKKIEKLRKLILETASEINGIQELEETLKWGEPSYLAKKGSTLRIDWKKSKPDQYAMYFKCTSKLVSTFESLYPDKFQFENNRAIVFGMNDKIPIKELKHCIALTLTYHRVKHLPLLGA